MWAIVPLKTFSEAKQRLAAVLSEAERRELMLAMARDVLTTLSHCKNLTGILIASRTTEADALAQAFATERFSESPDANLPQTLTQASEYLSRNRNARGVMIIPADVPMIDAAEIDEILADHDQVTLIPDGENLGTNGLLASPADAIEFIFDGRSFQPHLDAALAAEIRPAIVTSPNFALDIDTADDLRALLAAAPTTQTGTFLVKSGIARRLEAIDNDPSAGNPDTAP